MREGWEIKKWSEVLEIRSGRNQREVLNPKGKYPILGSAGKIMGFADRYICEEGTTIIGRKGNINSPMFIKEKFWNVDTAFGLHALESLDKSFLFYFCKGFNFTEMDKGSGRPSLVKSDLLEIQIPIPPLTEQKQIVTLLDQAFATIDQAKANIEKNIANAKELFQSKLNEIFSQKGDDWEEKTLIDVSKEFGRGKSKHRPRNAKELFGGKYPFIQTGDVRNTGKNIHSYSQTYNETGLSQSKLWPKGTICITIAANIAETGILDFDACFPDSIIGFIVDPVKAINDYAFYALQYLKTELQAQGKGSAQDNINLGTFKNQLFPFPNVETQKKIVTILDNINTNTVLVESKYEQKLTELEDLKKSLLQKAFTGELTNPKEKQKAKTTA